MALNREELNLSEQCNQNAHTWNFSYFLFEYLLSLESVCKTNFGISKNIYLY